MVLTTITQTQAYPVGPFDHPPESARFVRLRSATEVRR